MAIHPEVEQESLPSTARAYFGRPRSSAGLQEQKPRLENKCSRRRVAWHVESRCRRTVVSASVPATVSSLGSRPPSCSLFLCRTLPPWVGKRRNQGISE